MRRLQEERAPKVSNQEEPLAQIGLPVCAKEQRRIVVPPELGSSFAYISSLQRECKRATLWPAKVRNNEGGNSSGLKGGEWATSWPCVWAEDVRSVADKAGQL